MRVAAVPLLRIASGQQQLHPISGSQGDVASVQHRIIDEAVREGQHPHLHHVQPPESGISQGVKEAYLQEHQQQGLQRGSGGRCCGKCDCGNECRCSDACTGDACR